MGRAGSLDTCRGVNAMGLDMRSRAKGRDPAMAADASDPLGRLGDRPAGVCRHPPLRPGQANGIVLFPGVSSPRPGNGAISPRRKALTACHALISHETLGNDMG